MTIATTFTMTRTPCGRFRIRRAGLDDWRVVDRRGVDVATCTTYYHAIREAIKRAAELAGGDELAA